MYGYPKKEAAQIAVKTILAETRDAGEDFEVWLVAFDAATEKLYCDAIKESF